MCMSTLNSPIQRLTRESGKILEYLLYAHDAGFEAYGWEIKRNAGTDVTTTYKVLGRLLRAEWVSGRWEDNNPREALPRRKFYRLNPKRVSAARALVRQANNMPTYQKFVQPRIGNSGEMQQ